MLKLQHYFFETSETFPGRTRQRPTTIPIDRLLHHWHFSKHDVALHRGSTCPRAPRRSRRRPFPPARRRGDASQRPRARIGRIEIARRRPTRDPDHPGSPRRARFVLGSVPFSRLRTCRARGQYHLRDVRPHRERAVEPDPGDHMYRIVVAITTRPTREGW